MMMLGLTVLLVYQLAGEILLRGIGLALPGPVLGLVILSAALCLSDNRLQSVHHAADGLLRNIALLFIPAGVGVAQHLELIEGAAVGEERGCCEIFVYGEVNGRRWTDAVRHVFCLGTPHLGADLEKGVNALGRMERPVAAG